tara:strand:- start:3 stop:227 length:225 start_codon:yes stop_codon:yes gene_type:complete
MKNVEEYLHRERLLKDNGEPDESLFGVKMYKNKKAAKIAKEYYKGTTAWVNENGETLMFLGGTDVVLHFTNDTG